MLYNFRLFLILLFLTGAGSYLYAQEPVRSAALPSTPGTATGVSAGPYQFYTRPSNVFFHVGPFQETLIGNLTTAYTDNVNLTATDKISNLSFSLGGSLNTTWVISHLNQLSLNVGGAVTENLYGNGRNRVTFAIDPNSLLEFRFVLSDPDISVRLYDQFSYTQNPTTDPTATNTANLNSLTNTIGEVAAKNFGIVLFSLGADYSYNNQSGQNSNGANTAGTTGTRQTFRVTPALTFALSPEILYGVNATATRSSGLNEANVNTLNFGPFMHGKLGKKLDFDLAAGGTLVSTTPAIPSNYYATGALRYQLDPYLQFLLSGSHQLIFTTGTSLTEQNVVRIGSELGLTRFISLKLSPFINFGNVVTTTANSGTTTGPYTQFGVEAGITWHPRRRWTAELTYDYIRRETGSSSGNSGTSSDNYIQNTISLSLNYAF